MVSDHFPQDGVMLRAVRRGVPQRMMNKLRIFDPAALSETNFGPGGHDAKPVGAVVYPKRDEMLLLHYKWLGLNYLAGRHALMNTTRRARDVANNWSHHYTAERAQLAANLEHLLANAIDVIALGDGAWRNHREGRWWRDAKRGLRTEDGGRAPR
jgi:hypothetical protein